MTILCRSLASFTVFMIASETIFVRDYFSLKIICSCVFSFSCFSSDIFQLYSSNNNMNFVVIKKSNICHWIVIHCEEAMVWNGEEKNEDSFYHSLSALDTRAGLFRGTWTILMTTCTAEMWQDTESTFFESLPASKSWKTSLLCSATSWNTRSITVLISVIKPYPFFPYHNLPLKKSFKITLHAAFQLTILFHFCIHCFPLHPLCCSSPTHKHHYTEKYCCSLYRLQFSYYNFPVTPYTDGLKAIWCAHFQLHGYNIRWLAPTVQAIFEGFAAERCTYQWRSYSLKHRLGSTDSKIRLWLFWIQELNYCRLKIQLRVSWKAQWYPLLPFKKHCKINKFLFIWKSLIFLSGSLWNFLHLLTYTMEMTILTQIKFSTF